MHCVLEPEVAGGFGPETILDNSVYPPVISVLEYRFDGWLGDELLENFPCFIITKKMREDIEESSLTGYLFDIVKISTSETFNELYPNKTLPEFFWLKVTGTSRDDFYLYPDHRLVVSGKALCVLHRHNIQNCRQELLD